MNKSLLVAFIFLSTSGAFAFTLSEISEAYVTDSVLKADVGTFSEAINLLKGNPSRGKIVQAMNILIRIRQDGKLSVNRQSAVQAALEEANNSLDAVDLKGQ